ncbi:hypothetical protein VTK56DRAFT_6409 [Thermocarpiscus australiensis]
MRLRLSSRQQYLSVPGTQIRRSSRGANQHFRKLISGRSSTPFGSQFLTRRLKRYIRSVLKSLRQNIASSF